MDIPSKQTSVGFLKKYILNFISSVMPRKKKYEDIKTNFHSIVNASIEPGDKLRKSHQNFIN